MLYLLYVLLLFVLISTYVVLLKEELRKEVKTVKFNLQLLFLVIIGIHTISVSGYAIQEKVKEKAYQECEQKYYEQSTNVVLGNDCYELKTRDNMWGYVGVWTIIPVACIFFYTIYVLFIRKESETVQKNQRTFFDYFSRIFTIGGLLALFMIASVGLKYEINDSLVGKILFIPAIIGIVLFVPMTELAEMNNSPFPEPLNFIFVFLMSIFWVAIVYYSNSMKSKNRKILLVLTVVLFILLGISGYEEVMDEIDRLLNPRQGYIGF